MLKDRKIERLIPSTNLFLEKRDRYNWNNNNNKTNQKFQKSLPQGNEKQRLQGDIDRKKNELFNRIYEVSFLKFIG